MTSLPDLSPETRNLIDGVLCDASNGNTFDNYNPTTGELLGTAADGTKDDMLRAVEVARRAFDETDWSTNHEFRSKCIRQLYEGMLEEKEQLRAIVVREAGAAISLTSYMHIDGPVIAPEAVAAHEAELDGLVEEGKRRRRSDASDLSPTTARSQVSPKHSPTS